MAPGPIPELDTDSLGIKAAAGAGAAAGGIGEAVTGVGAGLKTATRALTRVREMLQLRTVTQAMDGLGEAIRHVAGQATVYAPDALGHLPEVGL